MALPDGYCVQNGCHNCTHVFLVCTAPPAYFCNRDKPHLPEKAFKWRALYGKPAAKKLCAAWLEWARAREVSCGGKCKRWRQRSSKPLCRVDAS